MERDAELEMAEHHVREARSHVSRQEELLESLRRDGHPTLEAEDLLRILRETLKTHQDILDQLKAEKRLTGPEGPTH